MTDALVEAVARAVYADMENHAAFDDEDSKALLLTYRDTATAALQAIEAAGYRVVPVEATEGIVNAILNAEHPNNHTAWAVQVWDDALSAAPRVGEGV